MKTMMVAFTLTELRKFVKAFLKATDTDNDNYLDENDVYDIYYIMFFEELCTMEMALFINLNVMVFQDNNFRV